MIDRSPEDAGAALASVQTSRTRLLAASETPPVRHAAFAAIMGVYVASPTVGSPGRYVVMALVLCAVALVVQWDRRRTGMFVNGYRAGRTRGVTAVILMAMLAAYLTGLWLADVEGVRWAPLALGAAVCPIGYAASRWWCRVFRREMLAELA